MYTKDKDNLKPTDHSGIFPENVAGWLHYCSRCNSCKFLYRDYRPSCPAFEKYLWESYTSSGKIWMARDIYEGKYGVTPSVAGKTFACTLCGNCTVQCQQKVSEHALDIFSALRELCVKEGLSPEAHRRFARNIEKYGNPYGEERPRFEKMEKYKDGKADIGLFIGCTTAYRLPGLKEDILFVLKKLGIKFTVIPEEICCGSPLLTTGRKDEAEIYARKNIETFARMGLKTVITACAGCYRTLKSEYPGKFGEIIGDIYNGNTVLRKEKKSRSDGYPNILHITEFLEKYAGKLGKLIRRGRKKIGKSAGELYTYHDPCHLGRHMGVFDPPRKLINLTGVKFEEMPRHGLNSWCCGAGAGVKSAFPQWALEIAGNRIREVRDICGGYGTAVILSACPFCELNLEGALSAGYGPGGDGNISVNTGPRVENIAEGNKATKSSCEVTVKDIISLIAEFIGKTETDNKGKKD